MKTKKTSKTKMYLHKQTSEDETINIKGGTVVELVIPFDPIKLTVPSFKT
tara:strand:+ start:4058 stop:4207 length:150 start_codon:yes stop_codon:yes gene_type:complete